MIFARDGGLTPGGEFRGFGRAAEDGFAGFLAAFALGEEDLGSGAKQCGNALEGVQKGTNGAVLEGHVVVQEQRVGKTGAVDALVDGGGETERGGGFDDFDGGMAGVEPGGGAVGGTVVDYNDLMRYFLQIIDQRGEKPFKEGLAVARRDDDGDARGQRRAGWRQGDGREGQFAGGGALSGG